MHTPSPTPSARMAAAMIAAAERAELARSTGDHAGAAYADAERRAYLRRIQRQAHR